MPTAYSPAGMIKAGEIGTISRKKNMKEAHAKERFELNPGYIKELPAIKAYRCDKCGQEWPVENNGNSLISLFAHFELCAADNE